MDEKGFDSTNKAEASNLYNQANVCVSLGDFTRALSYYSQAIALDRNEPTYYNNYASTLKRVGRLSEALQVYTNLTQLFPKYTKASLSLASSYIEAGMNEESISAYKIFLSGYKNGNFVFNPIVGGIDQSKSLFGNNALEIAFLNSINYLNKERKILAIKSYNYALNQLNISEFPEIYTDIALESIAINNAIISADYENNPEIWHYEVQFLERNAAIGDNFVNVWYLETNKKQGPSSSYSLIITVARDCDYNYPVLSAECGISSIWELTPPQENLVIYVYNFDQPSFQWSNRSTWDSNDQDQLGWLHSKVINLYRPKEIIIRVTEHFALALRKFLL
ncbi:tetratricopeptide repeat protein [Synechococcus sp. PCC 7502]|uniref:tetratricopeptide repeat protein n=1 Tax=Synechococcus sp. PCC 7502 TaxID=1173263 RepID=UPI00029FDBD3|nr:tetratricopeptide repeat protein [Synechococcus sp. PCC 7502]AFY73528.1 tetratricopeptide repeat protein [Synechococcus sp. PCC 7502]